MSRPVAWAKVIADSITVDGHRLTTMEVRFHRFVLAEFNTHRVFSRNSASSRAIPTAKMIQRVLEELAYPVAWPMEKPGMQGGEPLSAEDELAARGIWEWASHAAVQAVKDARTFGLHKSVLNRLLEPFLDHTVIVSSTAWNNFFGLRHHPDAQPEIREAAREMWDAYAASKPVLLNYGEWHLPYVTDDEKMDLPLAQQVQISTARCARVSYLTHEGVADIPSDLKLYQRLTTARPMHASSLEHPATPDERNIHHVDLPFAPVDGEEDTPLEHIRLTLPKFGNFLGWRQHRTEVEARSKYQAFA